MWQVGGWQALYTDIFCTPRELRSMFDFSLLDRARARLGCDDAFPHVYDKVKSEEGITDLSAEIASEIAAEDGKGGMIHMNGSAKGSMRKESGAMAGAA